MSRVSNVMEVATHRPGTRGVTQHSSTLRLNVRIQYDRNRVLEHPMSVHQSVCL